MKRLIEHPVIAGVLATLIATFFLWLLGFIWPAIWRVLSSSAVAAWKVAIYPVPVPALLVAVACILAVIWVIRHRAKKEPIEQVAAARNAIDNFNGQVAAARNELRKQNALGTIASALSREERTILEVLIERDGRPLVGKEPQVILELSNL